MVKTAETIKTARVARADEDGEYLGTKFAQVLYIWYPITFWKKSVLAFIDSNSEINIIYSIFAKELGLPIRLTDVRANKINDILLNTYKIVVTVFLVTDKVNEVKFFKKTFLVANVSLKIVFKMLFLTLSVANINFLN